MNKQRRKILDGVAEDIAKLNEKIEKAKEKVAIVIEGLESEIADEEVEEEVRSRKEKELEKLQEIANTLDSIEVDYIGAVT